MNKKPKVMITTRAATHWINRALKPDLEGLKKARTQQAILEFLPAVVKSRKSVLTFRALDQFVD